MLSNKEIYEIYHQYKIDLEICIKLPDILILSDVNQIGMAQIKNVTPESAELVLGNIFFEKDINKKYLYQVLYHEFTHILDQLSFFITVKDKKEHNNLLFPFTEFHAAQVEMIKRLELYYNPSKEITKSTRFYDMYNTNTLEGFLKDEQRDFLLNTEEFIKEPSTQNIQSIIYLIVYNIGYYSVCKKYNIDNELFIHPTQFSYIESDINNLKNLLLNEKPSEVLCLETNSITNNIFSKIKENLEQ